MTPTELAIELDFKHQVLRSGDRWALRRRQPDGKYETLVTWGGNKRSLARRLEEFGIHPSRAAEARLGSIPEATGFRERT